MKLKMFVSLKNNNDRCALEVMVSMCLLQDKSEQKNDSKIFVQFFHLNRDII